MPLQDHSLWINEHHGVKPLERDVLFLVGAGKSDQEIALQIHISERAVKQRIRVFCEREEFDARGGRRLAAWAARHGECCMFITGGQSVIDDGENADSSG